MTKAKAGFSDRFPQFADALVKHFKGMCKGKQHLFKTDVTKEELWETYLNSFPEGTNPIFRERPEFDCVYCKQFIRPCGNIVAIDKGKLVSIWDIPDLEYPYDVVAKALSDLVKSKNIRDIWAPKDMVYGTKSNKQQLEDGTVITWSHFHLTTPKTMIIESGKSAATVMGEYKSTKQVFERSMKELTLDAGLTVLELIDQGSLYRGEEHRKKVKAFIDYKKKFNKVVEEKKDIWFWEKSIGNPVSRIRNTALGTLLIDISEDMDLDKAVKKFESVMAPANYKRPKAIFTKKMVADAEAKIVELGLMDSLARRYAVLPDITVNNVIFVNRDAKKKMSGVNVFDSLKEEAEVVNPKTFAKVEEMSITDFLEKIVPKSKRIQLLTESRLQSNFMSLIAPKIAESKNLFKWDNNFSWAYCSDTTDSMKQHVKNAGGEVDGVLRFSIKWNDERGKNLNDYDAHCKEPGGNLIHFANKRNARTGGNLDVDIVNPNGVAVENITWPDLSKMEEGVYIFQVHNFSRKGGTNGFDAEIEFNGQIHSFSYHKDLKNEGKVTVAKVEYTKATGFKIIESLDSCLSTRKIWGITTNKWVDVSTLMFSPNYWDEQKGKGNRHFFFFLEGCKNEGNPRGFFNEFLPEELTKHRKVFEALGSKSRVEDSDDQLSGLGFSETQRNHIYVKVEGAFTRVIKINF